MQKRRGLESLRKLAEFSADSASRAVAEQLHVVHAESERLQQLEAYLGDYERLLLEGGGVAVAQMRSRRQFVQRLQDAVGQQEGVVRSQEQQYQERVDQWRAERARAMALARYAERLAEQQLAAEERRDQARLDEAGQDAYRRNSRP